MLTEFSEFSCSKKLLSIKAVALVENLKALGLLSIFELEVCTLVNCNCKLCHLCNCIESKEWYHVHVVSKKLYETLPKIIKEIKFF